MVFFFLPSETLLWIVLFLLLFASWGLGFIGLGLATLLTKKRAEQWRPNISQGLLRLISKTFPPTFAAALYPVLVVPLQGELPSSDRLLLAALASAVLAVMLYIGLAYAARMDEESEGAMEKIVLAPLKALRPHAEAPLKPLNPAPGKATNVPFTHDPALVAYTVNEGRVRLRRLGSATTRIELVGFHDWLTPAKMLDDQLLYVPRSRVRYGLLSKPPN